MDIYITWHYTSYGIAYLKHILSWFYKNNTLQPPLKPVEQLEQEDLNDVFDGAKKGKKFGKIIYLTAKQDTFDRVSSRRFDYKDNYEKDEIFKEKGLIELYEKLRNNPDLCYKLDKEIKYASEKYPTKTDDFIKCLWRDIQHYDISTQIKWLKEKSNFSAIYENDEFQEFPLDVNDLRDVKSIVNALEGFVKENLSKDDNCIVNISLGSAETEVAWFILADNGILPHNTKFIQTYDDKSIPGKRFKPFCIRQVPVKLIDDARHSFEFYKGTKSKKRELTTILFNKYLESGFPVLLLGERGTGKSHLLATTMKDKQKEPSEANCASFTDDNVAQSELFGYIKGAFTGATKKKDGLIKSAENGVLFLDEIHHLSKYMQAKLMNAFQTDPENNFHIRPVGSAKGITVKNVKLVFATNHTIEQLKNDLLPDFYDRIVQYVVEIPPLRETKEDLKEDIQKVYEYLYPTKEGTTKPKEEEMMKPENDDKLLKWVRNLELKGNYRDLQNIVRYYKIFNEFDKKTQKEICKQHGISCNSCNAYNYAKKCFEKYHLASDGKEKIIVDIDLSDSKNIKNAVLSQFANWAIEKFGSRKNAAKELDITEKTLYNWKNGNNNAHKTS